MVSLTHMCKKLTESFYPTHEIMVVWIRSIQKRTALNLPVILSNCNALMEILRIGHFDVNLMFVGKGYIKSLNLRYRRRNVVTDILAFPYFEVSGKKFITFANCALKLKNVKFEC